jgi:mannan endo-1,6-alpha-mannosidase
MEAAELGFPNPPPSEPQWLALGQAVFNSMVPSRWDTANCGGGLRWQIYPFNAGYDYKNTISTGGLFQLSARLARFTGNETYAHWANKTYMWLKNSPDIGPQYQVWDGMAIDVNCSNANQLYYTYNAGTLIVGAAYMYNYVSV